MATQKRHENQIEKLPQDHDAERAVLGSCLLNPNVIAGLRTELQPYDFRNPAHQEIFQSMCELNDADQPVDVVTLLARLDAKEKIETIGGPSYIADLAGAVPTSANADHYAHIVRDRADLRRIIMQTQTASQRAMSYDQQGTSAREILGDLQYALDNITHRNRAKQIRSTAELYADYEKRFHDELRGIAPIGLRTGIDFVDRWIPQGFQKDMTVTIGARSSDGKSTFLHNVLVNIGLAHGPALLCSIEEDAPRVLRRLHKILAPNKEFMDSFDLRDTHARDAILTKALGRVRQLPLYIEHGTPYIEDLRFKIKAHFQKHPETSCVAFDYFQLIRVRDQRLLGRDRFDYILDELAEIKRYIQAPVFILSQFRKEQIDPKKGPNLSLLKETGRIENDSDIIFLLYDASRGEDGNNFKPITELHVDIAKNRDFRPQKFRLMWYKPQYVILSPGQTRNDAFTNDQQSLTFERQPGEEVREIENTTNDQHPPAAHPAADEEPPF
ncbi:MAG: hypothetical protein IT367_18100 [Candidatus Hydrogenedentes bacterium]|nr:hypothetical protein [Candidatus Hydrogenedentota bacterium]